MMITSSATARFARVLACFLAVSAVAGPVWALADAKAVSGDATSAKATPVTPASAKTLYIEVQAPFVASSLHSTDIEDALLGSVIEQLRRAKFTGKIEEVARSKVPAGAAVLTVSLMNWRTTMMGDIECRFTADFRQADAETDLGWFDGRTSAIMRSRSRWFMGDDFVKAADDASASLVATLKNKGLL